MRQIKKLHFLRFMDHPGEVIDFTHILKAEPARRESVAFIKLRNNCSTHTSAGRWRSYAVFVSCEDSAPEEEVTSDGGWTNMAAVLRLVNRSTLSSAMGQQYLTCSSAAKVKTVRFLSTFTFKKVVVFMSDQQFTGSYPIQRSYDSYHVSC